MNKTALSSFSAAEIEALIKDESPYRAKQIALAIRAGAASFAEMTMLPIALRKKLEENFLIYSSKVSRVINDNDGTIKAQIVLYDGLYVEAVLLTDGSDRMTACLSTQAGCPMACVFCKTGSIGFSRNLSAGEIIEQFYHLRSIAGRGQTLIGHEISNIVVMGMGEPLLNLEALCRALYILGGGFSMRRVTISTCGIVSGIFALAKECPAARLAVSVPSAEQSLRDKLMPACAAYPLVALKDALLFYSAAHRRRITIETVLFSGINTDKNAADALCEFANGLSALVQLIPWNPSAGLCLDGEPLKTPSRAEVMRFKSMLEERGIKTELRRKKGCEASAACGQLGTSVKSLS